MTPFLWRKGWLLGFPARACPILAYSRMERGITAGETLPNAFRDFHPTVLEELLEFRSPQLIRCRLNCIVGQDGASCEFYYVQNSRAEIPFNQLANQ